MRRLHKNLILAVFCLVSSFSKGQIPKPALVGYWEVWSSMKLSEIHNNYNVIQLAFATTVGSSLYNMEFNLPNGYSKTAFLSDIDDLHSQGKVVILSLGGAADPIRLDNNTAKNTFVSSINQILSDYNYKIDGIDIDLETTSFNFGSWTMSNPAIGQSNMIDAVKQIMSDYQTQTGKKLLLTAAPETAYIQGGLSNWQVNNANGGAFLPILQGLNSEMDLLLVQLYNAGGNAGGNFGIDGNIYYDNGDPDYITSMTDAVIQGFTLKANKGTYTGLPASKVAVALPASYDGCVAALG
jgi:chitinase